MRLGPDVATAHCHIHIAAVTQGRSLKGPRRVQGHALARVPKQSSFSRQIQTDQVAGWGLGARFHLAARHGIAHPRYSRSPLTVIVNRAAPKLLRELRGRSRGPSSSRKTTESCAPGRRAAVHAIGPDFMHVVDQHQVTNQQWVVTQQLILVLRDASGRITQIGRRGLG